MVAPDCERMVNGLLRNNHESVSVFASELFDQTQYPWSDTGPRGPTPLENPAVTVNDATFHPPLPPPTEEETRAYLVSVAEALGDTPETVIAQQWLRESTTEVLCVGLPAEMEGIILQSPSVPGEPAVFGKSGEAVATLVPHLEGWYALNVPTEMADDLIAAVAEAAHVESVRLLDDIYFTLELPVNAELAGDALLLGADDADLIQGAGELLGNGSDRLLQTLSWGHVCGIVRDGQLVSVAYTFALSPRFADIGVVTREDWREQGLATEASARLCAAIQADGRVPVWSTGSTNMASQRVAQRLGFREVSRRVYLVPELDESADH